MRPEREGGREKAFMISRLLPGLTLYQIPVSFSVHLALRHSLTSSGALLLSTQLHPTLGNYPTRRQRGSLTGPQSLLMGVQDTHKSHTCTQTYTCIHTHAHTCICTHEHPCTRTCAIHTQMHTHAYTQMGSCTHNTHAHTATVSRAR